MKVSVWRGAAEGALQVVIETVDDGHAGEYGFAYSDVPLESQPMEDAPRWHTLALPGTLRITRPGDRIDAHWWKDRYNLD
jgi:hypothetical protein